MEMFLANIEKFIGGLDFMDGVIFALAICILLCFRNLNK